MGTVRIAPIQAADAQRVGEFLSANLNARVAAASWARAVEVPWSVAAPNRGFMLFDVEELVGVYLAFYSERTVNETVERFCNLGAWCVKPAYRLHSLRLLNALLAQPGYHFTDLSPSGNTVPVNERLKFKFLDTTTALVPNLPWPTWPGQRTISDDPAVIRRTLTGTALRLFSDHEGAGAARHVVLQDGQEWCYVVFRKDRRKNLPVFASVLHVSHPELFRRMLRQFTRHLLVRHGVLATLMELRVVAHRPQASILLRPGRRKMFRSAHLDERQIDYMYSELVCVAW